MSVAAALRAAGASDPGLQRDRNEDLFHIDLDRGLFIVVDGVGGQAAGGQAASVALSMLRARLERETGPTDQRVREAIAIANNEIHRLAQSRPDWKGMACVLTIALVGNGRLTVGHVGDTRLYRIRKDGSVQKVTRDHSPVGEREDAGELSEEQAMHHPRRNEVYRDVGSEPHEPGDPDFADVDVLSFDEDEALLLCTDGLSDLVTAHEIAGIVKRHAGDHDLVVRTLIDAANAAGGKDNVTAVYVEGDCFARSWGPASAGPTAATLRGPASGRPSGPAEAGPHNLPASRTPLLVSVALVFALLAAAALWFGRPWLTNSPLEGALAAETAGATDQVVVPGGSIGAALLRANPGTTVFVEPGEYREQVTFPSQVNNVRLVSRVPRGATLRLPADAAETDAAVIAHGANGADGLSAGEISGFRIVGDAATPLGTGIRILGAALSVVDVEIVGATSAAIEFVGAGATLLASDIHDNSGAAIVVTQGAQGATPGTPRIAHNSFARNGMSERIRTPFRIDPGSMPVFEDNTFTGISIETFGALGRDGRLALSKRNWFRPR